MAFPYRGAADYPALLRDIGVRVPVAELRQRYGPAELQAYFARWNLAEQAIARCALYVRAVYEDYFLAQYENLEPRVRGVEHCEWLLEYLPWIADECDVSVDAFSETTVSFCQYFLGYSCPPIPLLPMLDFYLRRAKRRDVDGLTALLYDAACVTSVFDPRGSPAFIKRLLDGGASLSPRLHRVPDMPTKRPEIVRWHNSRLACRAACLALLCVGCRRRADLRKQGFARELWRAAAQMLWEQRFEFAS